MNVSLSPYFGGFQNLRSIGTRTALAAGLTFALLTSLPVAAESVDYGAFEQLFGEPVTTSVTGSPQRASEVPASMEIITARDIRRSGARDIPGVLRHVTGIDVLQWGNDNADVSVRGYNQAASPRTLVLLDGRQVYADYYGMTPWAALPIELAAIRQIEIVKGPNSALFGFNAVGGVINIVSFNPLHDDLGEASFTVGTQGLAQGSLVAARRLGDDFGLRLVLGGNGNDDFSTTQRPLEAGSRRGNERAQMNLSGFWRVAAATEVGVEATRSQSEAADFLPSYTTLNQRHYTRSVQATLASDTNIGLLQGRVYGNWIDSVITSALLPQFRFRNHVLVAQVQDVFKLGAAHTIRLAAEYRHNTVNTTSVTGGQISYDVASASAMWQWSLMPTLTLTNALRLDRLALERSGFLLPGMGLTNEDWNHRSLSELSFNSGVVWQAGVSDRLRFSVARGAQLPSLFAFGSSLFPVGPGIYYGGVPFLQPTIEQHYDLAWDRLLPLIDGRLEFSVFENRASHVVANSGGPPVSAVLIATPINIGNSHSHGLELSLEGHIGAAWRWSAGLTMQQVVDKFGPAWPLAATLVDFEHTTPAQVFDASVGWAQGNWEIDGYLRHQSHNNGIIADAGAQGRLVPIAAYWSFDARVGYQFSPSVMVAVSGQNLLQQQQQQTSAAAVERRVLGTLTVNF